MGLAIEVGYLADVSTADEEGVAWFRQELQILNAYLASIRMAPHSEPEECETFSCGMYGYSGLHLLRRVAAHLDLRRQLPEPGDYKHSNDGVQDEYYRQFDHRQPGILGRLFGRPSPRRSFDHLMIHSDAEGYYLPQDFPDVLLPPLDSYPIPGGMIGSSVRLLEECQRLSTALELPPDLDPDSDEFVQELESQGNGSEPWQRYAIETYTCLNLMAACRHSLKTGAAVVFC